MSVALTGMTTLSMMGIYGQPGNQDTLPFFSEVPHGSPYVISRVEFDGHFGSEDIRSTFTFYEAGDKVILVAFIDGRVVVSISLKDEEFPSLNVTQLTVFRSGNNNRRLVIQIPFGEPYLNCFVNGSDVFAHVRVVIDGARVDRSAVTEFMDCSVVDTPLSVNVQDGSFVIARTDGLVNP